MKHDRSVEVEEGVLRNSAHRLSYGKGKAVHVTGREGP
jgi:hypothetical protein